MIKPLLFKAFSAFAGKMRYQRLFELLLRLSLKGFDPLVLVTNLKGIRF